MLTLILLQWWSPVSGDALHSEVGVGGEETWLSRSTTFLVHLECVFAHAVVLMIGLHLVAMVAQFCGLDGNAS